MKPFKFEPYLKETIWGGKQIAEYKGIKACSENIGESWEISGVKGHESIVAEGGTSYEDKGLTISELIQKYREKLLGEKVYEQFGTDFPLLIKFIDSRQDLSVQVHPDDKLAKERHGCQGKTEMWYIINSKPGAKIYAGLNKHITPEDYVRMTDKETIDGHSPLMDVIAAHDSHVGDIFFLPAGRLHSIGAGNLLVEIQQTSDITYRVYDFGRRDANGNTRELHIDLAKDAIDYNVYTDIRSTYDKDAQIAELVKCKYFDVRKLTIDKEASIDFKIQSFVIAICLKGTAEINGTCIRQGETILVPADNNILNITGTVELLTAFVP